MANHDPLVSLLWQSSYEDDPSVRSAAEQQLSQLMRQTGKAGEAFQTQLLEVAVGAQDQSTRLAAALAFKNMLKSQILSTRGSLGMSARQDKQLSAKVASERAHAKQSALQVLASNVTLDTKVEVALVVCVAETARFDWPVHWDTLFPTILQNIDGNTAQSQPGLLRRKLFLLHQVLKKLHDVRLPAARKALRETAASAVEAVFSLWGGYFQQLAQDLEQGNVEIGRAQLTKLLTKCLQRLVVFALPVAAQHVQPMFGKMLEGLVFLSQARQALAAQDRAAEITAVVTKTVLVMARAAEFAASNSMDTFVHMAEPYLSYFYAHILAQPNAEHAESKLTVIALNFLHRLVGSSSGDVRKLVQQFFSSSGEVNALISTLMTHFLPLTPSDLCDWQEDPVEFYNQEDQASAELSTRVAAERLLLALVSRVPSVVPHLLELIQQSASVSSASATDDNAMLQLVLQKEALLHSVGVCAMYLAEAMPSLNAAPNSFSFARWYTSTLTQELSAMEQVTCGAILRRRIVWLVGEWVQNDELPPQALCVVLGDTMRMLCDKDTVVRLTACDVLRNVFRARRHATILDSASVYSQALPKIIAAMFALQESLQDVEMAKEVLDTIKRLVSSMVLPLDIDSVQPLLEGIQQLWAQTVQHQQQQQQEHPLQSVALQLAKSTVQLLGRDSAEPAVHQLMCALIKGTVEPWTAPTRSNVVRPLAALGPALQLWQCVVAHMEQCTAELADLFALWLTLADPSKAQTLGHNEALESLQVLQALLRSYLLLTGPTIMAAHAEAVHKVVRDCFMGVMSAPSAARMSSRPSAGPGFQERQWRIPRFTGVGQTLELLVQLFGDAYPDDILMPPVVAFAVQRMLEEAKEEQSRPQDARPTPTQMDNQLMFSHYIQLFGRLMLVAQDNMVALFKQLGQADAVLLPLIAMWSRSVPHIQPSSRQKLAVLVLLSFLPSSDTALLKLLAPAIRLAPKTHASFSRYHQMRLKQQQQREAMELAGKRAKRNCEEQRLEQVEANDPVYKVSLADFCSQKLQATQQMTGQSVEQLLGQGL